MNSCQKFKIILKTQKPIARYLANPMVPLSVRSNWPDRMNQRESKNIFKTHLFCTSQCQGCCFCGRPNTKSKLAPLLHFHNFTHLTPTSPTTTVFDTQSQIRIIWDSLFFQLYAMANDLLSLQSGSFLFYIILSLTKNRNPSTLYIYSYTQRVYICHHIWWGH